MIPREEGPGALEASPPPPDAITMVIEGPIAPVDIAGLCEQARAVFEEREAHVMLCELGDRVAADAVAVDALARLQLTVRRLGGEVLLRNAREELLDLIVLMGLEEIVSRSD